MFILMKAWTDRSCLNGSFTTVKVASTYHVLAVAIISICLSVAKRRWRLSFTLIVFLKKVSGMALWRKSSSKSKSVVVGSSGRRPFRARLHAMCSALAAGGWPAVTCRSTTSAMMLDAGAKIFSVRPSLERWCWSPVLLDGWCSVVDRWFLVFFLDRADDTETQFQCHRGRLHRTALRLYRSPHIWCGATYDNSHRLRLSHCCRLCACRIYMVDKALWL